MDYRTLLDKPFREDPLPGTVKLLDHLPADRPLGPIILSLRLGRKKLVHEQSVVSLDWRVWPDEKRGNRDRIGQVSGEMQYRRTIVHRLQQLR